MRRLILFSLCMFFGTAAHATTRTAATCNQSDVQTQITASSNGDTVLIPNGNCSWSGTIDLTIAITLQGVSAQGVCSYPNGGVNCGLQITDTNATSCSNHGAPCQPDGSNLLIIEMVPGFRTIIGNISFHPGTGVGNYILLRGSGGLQTLLHDVSMENGPNMVNEMQWMQQGGVIWNFDLYNSAFGTACFATGANGNGGLFVNSTYAWDNPTTMGMADTTGTVNLYVEDSRFYQVDQTPDVGDNGRIVMRHMIIDGSAGLTHGPTNAFGGRAVEYYQNQLKYSFGTRNLVRYFWLRMGTLLMTQNGMELISSATASQQQNGCFQTEFSFVAVVEAAKSNADGHGCCTITATGNSCWHQAGTGAAATPPAPFSPSNLYTSQTGAGGVGGDTSQFLDPVYIWNNTGTGQGSTHYGTNESGLGDQCNNINPNTGLEYATTDFYKNGQQYHYDDSSSNTGAKPGWTPYTYPHPLRALVNGAPTVSPSGTMFAKGTEAAVSPGK